MAALPAPLCGNLNSIAASGQNMFGKALGKLNSMRRLASIMRKFGDGIPLPDTSALTAISQINASAYTNLASTCPILGLPALPSPANVSQLQQSVAQGYSSLLSFLDKHPYTQMGRLQGLVDDSIATATNGLLAQIGPGMDILACLQTSCGTVGQIGDTVTASYEQSKTSFNSAYQAGGTALKVLDESGQAKVDSVNDLKSTLKSLLTS